MFFEARGQTGQYVQTALSEQARIHIHSDPFESGHAPRPGIHPAELDAQHVELSEADVQQVEEAVEVQEGHLPRIERELGPELNCGRHRAMRRFAAGSYGPGVVSVQQLHDPALRLSFPCVPTRMRAGLAPAVFAPIPETALARGDQAVDVGDHGGDPADLGGLPPDGVTAVGWSRSHAQAGTTLAVVRYMPTTNKVMSRSIHPQVLVVDDEPMNSMIVQMLLQHLNCDATVANDLDGLLSAIKAEPFDLIITDISLGDEDVRDAVDGIRQADASWSSRRPGPVSLVALTGHASVESRQQSLDAGFDEHLTKPVRVEQLAQLIDCSAILGRPGAAPGQSR